MKANENMRSDVDTGATAVECRSVTSRPVLASVMAGRATRGARFSLGASASVACPARASDAGPFATEEIAEGIHIRRGLDEDATQANENAIANTGFILGREAVLVTDPGGSLVDGEMLRATIAQTTSLPVKYVAMSHVHPDHIFGASAFLKDAPVYIGHARLAEALQQRGAYYRDKLSTIFGAGTDRDNRFTRHGDSR